MSDDRWKGSPGVKLTVLAGLILLMMLPLGQLLSLVRERQERALTVREEIATTWGEAQRLGGAVLRVPYQDRSGPRPVTRHLVFLPAKVHWEVALRPELRRRGIFEVPVYEGELEAVGEFRLPDLEELGIEESAVSWQHSTLSVGILDVSGIQRVSEVRWGQSSRSFDPGSGTPAFRSGIHASTPIPSDRPSEPIAFSFDLRLRGTSSLHLLPLGDRTTTRISSTWPSPSFDGSFLPEARDVGEEGFLARWDVSHFGRDYPQLWREGDLSLEELRNAMSASAFGLSLATPADQYQQTERSAKYGLLFIALTFTCVFLLELLAGLRLHPVQYLLVGFALCLFYLLLLSLSEQIDFRVSYLAATAATVILVALYAGSILRSRRRGAILGGCLLALYVYLFTLLRAEQYALLMGSVGLFLILAAIMFLTRHVDWWRLRLEPGKRELEEGAGRVGG